MDAETCALKTYLMIPDWLYFADHIYHNPDLDVCELRIDANSGFVEYHGRDGEWHGYSRFPRAKANWIDAAVEALYER